LCCFSKEVDGHGKGDAALKIVEQEVKVTRGFDLERMARKYRKEKKGEQGKRHGWAARLSLFFSYGSKVQLIDTCRRRKGR